MVALKFESHFKQRDESSVNAANRKVSTNHEKPWRTVVCGLR
jgi:hypothetical protein